MERFTKEYLIDILENQDYKGFIFLHPQIWQHKDLIIDAASDELDMEIPDEDAESFVTVGDVVKFVKSHVEE